MQPTPDRRTFLQQLLLMGAAVAWPGGFNARSSAPLINGKVSDFSKSLTPVGRILETEGYYVWCNSPIYDENGKVHVFYSRWPEKYGMGGWTICLPPARVVNI